MRPIKHINWMELSGLLVGVFLTVAVMVFGITLYAKLFNSGMIGVEEYKLNSHFEKAMGLDEGTKVQISGVEVGRVSKIKLEQNGVFMEFTIRKQYQNWITDSATVFAVRDQNVISSRVINIDVRRMGRVLEDGETLQSGQAQDIETMLETADNLLRRIGELVEVADTMVALVMDTGTTIGALLGSRALYDNLNTQLVRLDKITNIGTSLLLDMNGSLPKLLSRSDSLLTDVSTLVSGMGNVPDRLNGVFEKLDGTFGNINSTFGKVDGMVGRMDGLVSNLDGVSKALTGFVDVGAKTLQNADEMVDGISNMWIIRRSLPVKDTIPLSVETLW